MIGKAFKFRNITLILGLVGFIGAYLFIALSYCGHLSFWCGNNYWEWTLPYFREFIRSAGWTNYMTNFLQLFYKWVWLGSFIFLLPPVFTFFLSRALLKKVEIPSFFEVLALLPPLILFILELHRLYFLFDAFYFVFYYLFVLVYLRLKNRRLRVLVSLLAYPILFFLVPVGTLIFLYVSLGVAELLFFSPREDRTKFYSALLVAFLWIALCFHYPLAWDFLVEDKLPMDYYTFGLLFEIKNYTTFTTAIYVFPLLILLFGRLLRGRPFSCRTDAFFAASFLLAIVLLGYAQFPYSKYKDFESFFLIEKACMEEDWDEVVRLTESQREKTNKLLCFSILAHSAKGDLPDVMFEYPLTLTSNFFPASECKNTTINANVCFYDIIGVYNQALAYAFQNSNIRLNEFDVCVLKTLIKLSVRNGEFEVAEKYLCKLDKTLVNGDFVDYWHAENIKMRNCQRANPENQNLIYVSLDKSFDLYRLMAHSHNETSLDMLLCRLLQLRNYNNFVDVFVKYYPKEKRRLPKVYEEFLIMAPHIGFHLPQMDFVISKETESRFSEFLSLYNNTNLDESLKQQQMKKYADTWFYYAVYGK